MRVLVVNAGSSSLKLRLLDGADQLLQSADVPADAAGFDETRVDELLDQWPAPDAAGHRIVHGGTQFDRPVVIDGEVRQRLQELTALAPLHQPKSLAALDAVTARLPGIPAVASFDTAFHATLPAAASTYAVPREWRERYGVRRYGFHGLSHAYAAQRAGELVHRAPAGLRVITCLAAVVGGVSVDTTMGFTPLEGLVMATRSGSVDPGLLLWLIEEQQLSAHEISTALSERSGLAALAGTADMREVEQAAAAGDGDAQLALDVYLHRLVAGIGAMTASAGGIDVLVFTGGVGEHSPLVRRRAAAALGHLGVAVASGSNDGAQGDCDISAPEATVATIIVEAREDLQIAGETRLSLIG